MDEQKTPEAQDPQAPERRTAFVPNVEIELDQDKGFRIRLDKARLAELFDQSQDMQVSPGQGCISAPGGPRC